MDLPSLWTFLYGVFTCVFSLLFLPIMGLKCFGSYYYGLKEWIQVPIRYVVYIICLACAYFFTQLDDKYPLKERFVAIFDKSVRYVKRQMKRIIKDFARSIIFEDEQQKQYKKEYKGIIDIFTGCTCYYYYSFKLYSKLSETEEDYDSIAYIVLYNCVTEYIDRNSENKEMYFSNKLRSYMLDILYERNLITDKQKKYMEDPEEYSYYLAEFRKIKFSERVGSNVEGITSKLCMSANPVINSWHNKPKRGE